MEARLSVSQVTFECLCQWVRAGDTVRRAGAHQSHPVHRRDLATNCSQYWGNYMQGRLALCKKMPSPPPLIHTKEI